MGKNISKAFLKEGFCSRLVIKLQPKSWFTLQENVKIIQCQSIRYVINLVCEHRGCPDRPNVFSCTHSSCTVMSPETLNFLDSKDLKFQPQNIFYLDIWVCSQPSQAQESKPEVYQRTPALNQKCSSKPRQSYRDPVIHWKCAVAEACEHVSSVMKEVPG